MFAAKKSAVSRVAIRGAVSRLGSELARRKRLSLFCFFLIGASALFAAFALASGPEVNFASTELEDEAYLASLGLQARLSSETGRIELSLPKPTSGIEVELTTSTQKPPKTTEAELTTPETAIVVGTSQNRPAAFMSPGAGSRSALLTELEVFAEVGEVKLTLPSRSVEVVGFHESNHDGAQQMMAAFVGDSLIQLESRKRDTASRGAADIVVAPATDIWAPVSGTVKRAGNYVLYCDHRDDFVVISPDVAPHLEVKMLHIDGVQVAPGEKVTAGVTLLAPGATVLPFESQVDSFTADPSWPHVHIEVVDPSVKDRPSTGGC